MKLTIVGLVLLLGIIFGASVPPLFAQAQSPEADVPRCSVGEGSGAACSGKWIYFAGNTGNLDESAWLIRINSETEEIWFKNGRRMQRLEESD